MRGRSRQGKGLSWAPSQDPRRRAASYAFPAPPIFLRQAAASERFIRAGFVMQPIPDHNFQMQSRAFIGIC